MKKKPRKSCKKTKQNNKNGPKNWNTRENSRRRRKISIILPIRERFTTSTVATSHPSRTDTIVKWPRHPDNKINNENRLFCIFFYSRFFPRPENDGRIFAFRYSPEITPNRRRNNRKIFFYQKINRNNALFFSLRGRTVTDVSFFFLYYFTFCAYHFFLFFFLFRTLSVALARCAHNAPEKTK